MVKVTVETSAFILNYEINLINHSLDDLAKEVQEKYNEYNVKVDDNSLYLRSYHYIDKEVVNEMIEWMNNHNHIQFICMPSWEYALDCRGRNNG
jgi:hypothetical protein